MEISEVIKAVAIEFGTDIAGIMSHSRRRDYIEPRQMAIHILARRMKLAQWRIARALNASVAMVRYSIVCVDDKLRTDRDTQQSYYRCLLTLGLDAEP